MSEIFDNIAYDAVSQAADYVMRRSPGMSEFYRIMSKRQSDEPSVSVRILMENGRPVLEYGVSFVKGLERSLLGSILYMQCMKLALHHCDRRKKEPYDVYKLASDLVVAEYGKNLVDCSVPGNTEILNRLFPSVWNYWATLGKDGFEMGSDLYLEKVFELLKGRDSGESSDGESDESDESDDSDSRSGADDDGACQGSSSKPGDDGDCPDQDTDGGNQAQDGTDGTSGQGDGDCQGGSDGHSDGGTGSYGAMAQYFSTDTAADDLSGWGRDELAEGSIQAAAARADRSGSLDRMPGMLPVMIGKANRIRVNVESLFKHFIDSAEDDDFDLTWSRRDRRLPRTPIVTSPGKMAGRTHSILLAVDVSGSMYYMGLIEDCIRVMDGIVNGLTIDVCYWDACCSDIFSRPRSMDGISVSGGGSTDPVCVLDRVRECRREYDGIVYLTDCQFMWDARPANARKIMFICADGRTRPPKWSIHSMQLADLLKSR